MPTLLLTPRYTEDAQALWRAAIDRGWEVIRLKNWQVEASLKSIADPILYVDALLSPLVAAELGLHLLETSADWLVKLPAKYRRRWIYLTSLEEARNIKTPAFIKPPNDKSFPARVYIGTDLPLEYDDLMSVLVAEIVEWEKEFRCFILERKLQTFSIYSRHGIFQKFNDFQHSLAEERELQDFMTKLLTDPAVELPRSTVIDVGIIRDRGWAVVEANAAWGAGIYGCDPDRVLDVLLYGVSRDLT